MTPPLPITWQEDGLIPAVIQDSTSGDVLMVGFMNETALAQTRSTGFVHFWSRSRGKLWKKGETSGHVQRVENIFVNCELNSLLIEVQQTGAVCHEGYPTCYFRRLEADNSLETVRSRWFDPADVYGDANGVAATTARWWGAYLFLKQQEFKDVSQTALSLLGNSSVVPRIQDEMRELAGVLEGSHIHTNQHDDAVLEASQVYYWVAIEAIRRNIELNAVRPDRALDASDSDAMPQPATMAGLLRAAANRLSAEAFEAHVVHDVFSLVAGACLALEIDPMEPIRKDLEDLRSRDYLAPYFAR